MCVNEIGIRRRFTHSLEYVLRIVVITQCTSIVIFPFLPGRARVQSCRNDLHNNIWWRRSFISLIFTFVQIVRALFSHSHSRFCFQSFRILPFGVFLSFLVSFCSVNYAPASVLLVLCTFRPFASIQKASIMPHIIYYRVYPHRPHCHRRRRHRHHNHHSSTQQQIRATATNKKLPFFWLTDWLKVLLLWNRTTNSSIINIVSCIHFQRKPEKIKIHENTNENPLPTFAN